MIPKIKKLFQEKNVSSLIANVGTAFLGLIGFMLLTRQMTKEDLVVGCCI